MKNIILGFISGLLVAIILLAVVNPEILDFFKDEVEIEKVKDEIEKVKEVEKCIVTDQVLNTDNPYMIKISGATNCNMSRLQYKLYCFSSLHSVESGHSLGGTFNHSFLTHVDDCFAPKVEVVIR